MFQGILTCLFALYCDPHILPKKTIKKEQQRDSLPFITFYSTNCRVHEEKPVPRIAN